MLALIAIHHVIVLFCGVILVVSSSCVPVIISLLLHHFSHPFLGTYEAYRHVHNHAPEILTTSHQMTNNPHKDNVTTSVTHFCVPMRYINSLIQGTLLVPIPEWYISSIPIPWYHGMENPYHPLIPIPWYGKPIPYPTRTNTMSHTIPCHLMPYHLTSYHTIRGVWGPFYKI